MSSFTIGILRDRKHSALLRRSAIKRKGNQYRAFIAVYADDVRLIDNIALNN